MSESLTLGGWVNSARAASEALKAAAKDAGQINTDRYTVPVPRLWLVGGSHNVGTAHPLIGVRAAFGSYPGSPLVLGIPSISLRLRYNIAILEWSSGSLSG